MKKLIPLTVTPCLFLLTLSACYNSGDPYAGAWFDAFGNNCSYTPVPGCDYFSNGLKIQIWQDPYYSGSQSSIGHWQSPDGIEYENGYAINSQDQDASESADIISQAADQDLALITAAGKSFAQKYALAETSGIQIAQTLQDWATLGKSRARTDDDIADFSKRLYGVDAASVQTALANAATSHDLTALEPLNEQVAAHWGTTPEVSKQILKHWYQGTLDYLQIK